MHSKAVAQKTRTGVLRTDVRGTSVHRTIIRGTDVLACHALSARLGYMQYSKHGKA